MGAYGGAGAAIFGWRRKSGTGRFPAVANSCSRGLWGFCEPDHGLTVGPDEEERKTVYSNLLNNKRNVVWVFWLLA